MTLRQIIDRTGRRKPLWLQATLGLLAVMGLWGCSDDEGAPSVKGERMSIVVQQCVTGFDDHIATRGWAPPSPYVLYTSIYGTNGMFANQKNLVNKSIDAFFTQGGQAPQEGVFFYRNSDTSWHLDLESLTTGTYQVYGYIPKEDAESATVGYLDDSYNTGAVLTINGLNSVTPSDVCVIVGAKNDDSYDPNTSNYNVSGLATGQFGVSFTSGDNATNHIFLLFDHLYAALRFNFKVDAVYNALRTIKLRKLELVAYADDSGGGVRAKFKATVTLRQNDSGASPIDEVSYKADETSAYVAPVPLYEWDGTKNTATDLDNEVILNPDTPTQFMGCFVPGMNTYFKLRSTYDVFDKKENLIRQNCQAENTIDLRELFSNDLTTMRGHCYSITMTVQPTYLYMLSEPDMDNPTVRTN